MLNEGVSKQAHPLFLRFNAQTHFLGQYLAVLYVWVWNVDVFLQRLRRIVLQNCWKSGA